MEGEILDKLVELYNFRIDVTFKDLRQYEIYGRIDNEKVFCIPILYDVTLTLEANITNIRSKIDKEIVNLFRRKEEKNV